MATAYGVVDDLMAASIVVDVNGHAAKGRDLGGQLVEAGVVLPLALVCLGHGDRLQEMGRGGGGFKVRPPTLGRRIDLSVWTSRN
jgi:hypothetical protein